MAPKRAAKRPAPSPPARPPASASSEETDSRSRSDESEDDETLAVSAIPASKKDAPTPPQKIEDTETSEEEEEQDQEEESARAALPSDPKNPPLPPPGQGEESDTYDDEEEECGSEYDEEAPPTRPAPVLKTEDPKPQSSGDAKMPFRRIWSTDDEVRILEALASHHQKHGELPQPDDLVAALAGRLDNAAYGSKELQGKVKALKFRCINLSKKSKIPNKEHDRRLLDLSKIVWAGDKAAGAITTKANGQEPREFVDMCEKLPYLAEEVKLLDVAHPGLFKRPFGMIDDDKAGKLDMKIKKQRVVQVRLQQRSDALSKEVIKTLLELIQ